jgi:hypothetical protein
VLALSRLLRPVTGWWTSQPRLIFFGTVLLALVAVVVLCVAGNLYRHSRSIAAAEAELTAYLERVRDGDFHGVYEQLCVDVTAYYGPAEHVDYLRSQPRLESFEIVEGGSTQTGRDGTYAFYLVRLTYVDGNTAQAFFVIGLETRGPKVCDSPERTTLADTRKQVRPGVGDGGHHPRGGLRPR